MKKFRGRVFQSGQGLLEYLLLLVLSVMVIALSLSVMGVSVGDLYKDLIGGFRGEGQQPPACKELARPGKDWTAFKDSFWRGGINQTGGAYEVCSLCGGLLPGYSGDDYTVKLLGVQVKNIHPTWNGYGVAFRADYGKNGLSGYMVEMEKLNKNAPVVLYFSKWVDGKQIKPPLASVNMPAGYDINNPQNLGVKVEGDRFTAFLDGKQVLMTSDPTFTSGSAGVYSNHGTLLTFGGLDVDSVACNTFE